MSDEIRMPAGTPKWLDGDPEDHERRVEVKTYRVSLICPECKTGEMFPNGMEWLTAPPGVHHTCDNCGITRAVQGRHYPMTVYEHTHD